MPAVFHTGRIQIFWKLESARENDQLMYDQPLATREDKNLPRKEGMKKHLQVYVFLCFKLIYILLQVQALPIK